MGTMSFTLLLIASLTAAGPAQGAASPAEARGNRPASLSALGTIEAFDAASRTLKLKTAQGTQTFTLADSTLVRHGAKPASPAQLAAWTGRRAKVRFTEIDGRRSATSVMVDGTPHHATTPASQ